MLEEIEETAGVGDLILILASLAGIHFGERLFGLFPVDLHGLQVNAPSEKNAHLREPVYLPRSGHRGPRRSQAWTRLCHPCQESPCRQREEG